MNINEFISLVEKHVRRDTTVDKGSWVIYINGHRVVMKSGKRVWSTRGGAMNALHGSIKSDIIDTMRSASESVSYRQFYEDYRNLLKEAINRNIIEIRNI